MALERGLPRVLAIRCIQSNNVAVTPSCSTIYHHLWGYRFYKNTYVFALADDDGGLAQIEMRNPP